ncbi:MAG: hypothetical protein JRG95_09995 [Deltaproteobacteria bacterium]|nr:hypothetical protein [Deltaproteobacteria bacterium]
MTARTATRWIGGLLAVALMALGSSASATPIYDEGSDGAVSTDPFTPTVITAVLGSNEIVLTFGPSDTVNYFEIDLGGMTLTQVLLNSFQTQPGNAASLLVNCDTGSVCSPWNPLASEKLETAAVGSDLLPGLLADLGVSDVLTNRWGTAESQEATTVSLTFVVAAVPEPSIALMCGVAALAMAGLRHRREH